MYANGNCISPAIALSEPMHLLIMSDGFETAPLLASPFEFVAQKHLHFQAGFRLRAQMRLHNTDGAVAGS